MSKQRNKEIGIQTFYFHFSSMDAMLPSPCFTRPVLRAYGDAEMPDPLRLSPAERQKGTVEFFLILFLLLLEAVDRVQCYKN